MGFFLSQNRRRRESLPVADGDIYYPPYGVQLPNYTEINSHKDFNPPDYENISVVYDNPAFCTSSSGTLDGCLDYSVIENRHIEVQIQPASNTSDTLLYLKAEVHASPKQEVQRPTYVTWI